MALARAAAFRIVSRASVCSGQLVLRHFVFGLKFVALLYMFRGGGIARATCSNSFSVSTRRNVDFCFGGI